jgi:hypothetical protein
MPGRAAWIGSGNCTGNDLTAQRSFSGQWLPFWASLTLFLTPLALRRPRIPLVSKALKMWISPFPANLPFSSLLLWKDKESPGTRSGRNLACSLCTYVEAISDRSSKDSSCALKGLVTNWLRHTTLRLSLAVPFTGLDRFFSL